MDHDGRKTDTSEAVNSGVDSEGLGQQVYTVEGSREEEAAAIHEQAASVTAEATEPEAGLFMEQDEEAGETFLSENDSEETPVLSDTELNEVIEGICNSKAEEFHMLGYEHVTGRDIWECVSDKYNKTGTPPLHKVVNDILSLKVTQFMNWMTMSIYKSNPFQ